MDNNQDETILSFQKRIREQYELVAIMFPHWLAKGAPLDLDHTEVLRLPVKALAELLEAAIVYELRSHKKSK